MYLASYPERRQPEGRSWPKNLINTNFQWPEMILFYGKFDDKKFNNINKNKTKGKVTNILHNITAGAQNTGLALEDIGVSVDSNYSQVKPHSYTVTYSCSPYSVFFSMPQKSVLITVTSEDLANPLRENEIPIHLCGNYSLKYLKTAVVLSGSALSRWYQYML